MSRACAMRPTIFRHDRICDLSRELTTVVSADNTSAQPMKIFTGMQREAEVPEAWPAMAVRGPQTRGPL